MPLGAHVVYEIEVGPGIFLKLSEPREGNSILRASGQQVRVAPTSAAACRVFPLS